MDETEGQRLAKLFEYKILDTAPEKEFDGITALATELFDVPIALVSLVDEGRQWFKSKQGLSVCETPREISFCQHVVQKGAPLVVKDTLKDSNFRDNALVFGYPEIRFYAGVPLTTPTGHVLGSFCIMDRKPRPFGKKQLKMLTALGTQVTMQLELRLLLQRKRDAQSQIISQQEEVDSLNTELSKLLDIAIAASRSKANFLATMSHEIRTPLNGILGLSELLLAETLPPKVASHIATIHKSGVGLLELLNDILDVSKIDAGKMSIEATQLELKSIVADVAELMTPRLREKQLTLKISEPKESLGPLTGDKHKIRQILINFLSNATKFTPTGSIEIKWTLVSENPEQSRIRISVSDSGIGIPESKIKGLFESFSQADGSTTRKFGGTGLGLSICRKLAKLMGGEVGVISKEGEGSTFWLELELKKADKNFVSVAKLEPRSTLQDLSGLTVLLVEDNAVNRTVAEGFLAQWKCGFKTAKNGLEALEILAKERFDIILMDVQMPDMDGYQATSEIRKRETTTKSHVPIIAMTAHAMEGDRATCLKMGMDDYISKPLRGSSFRLLLDKWAIEIETQAPNTGSIVGK